MVASVSEALSEKSSKTFLGAGAVGFLAASAVSFVTGRLGGRLISAMSGGPVGGGAAGAALTYAPIVALRGQAERVGAVIGRLIKGADTKMDDTYQGRAKRTLTDFEGTATSGLLTGYALGSVFSGAARGASVEGKNKFWRTITHPVVSTTAAAVTAFMMLRK